MARITLKAGGKREKVSKERAEDTVQRWRMEAKGNQVTGIDISCLSWSLEGFNVIKPFLQEVASTVKYANLADIIASLMTDEGLAVIEGVVEVFRDAPLVDVDLSDNALGLRGMERIKGLLTGTPLRRLYLTNCGFSAESMVHLKDCMEANDNAMGATLKELVLDRNMMGTKGAQEVGEILSKCNLEYFSYLGCRIQEGTLFLANGIKHMAENAAKPSLIRLDIDDGNFGEDEPAYLPLAEGLKRCSQLRHLDLTDAKLEIEGLTCVVDAMTAAGVKLTHLGLESCGELGSEGAEILAKFMDTQSTTLEVFKCGMNELGDSGLPVLLEPFGATKCMLKELHLECNELGEESAKALVGYPLPRLAKLNLMDNMDIPKKYLKMKYGNTVIFDEDDDEEDEEEEQDDLMDDLVKQFQTTNL